MKQNDEDEASKYGVEMDTRFWRWNLEGRDHLQDLREYGRIILQYIL